MNQYRRWFLLVAASGLLLNAVRAVARPLTVRVERWLELQRMTGSVQFINSGGQNRPATLGTRLQSVGEGVQTGTRSSAVLAVDTQIGFVLVEQNTALRIVQMRTTSSGGRITRLSVDRGQARLRVRPFNNPDSQLEIITPAGVSGVRGTEFGVSVQPNGKTGVATLEGRVVASAQGESIALTDATQSLIIPGEAPLPPSPLTDDPSLVIAVLRIGPRTDGDRIVQLVGQTDPVNLLVVNGEIQPTDRAGAFDLRLQISGRRLRANVITPLGTEEAYDLVAR
ncbi:FecR family protein [Vasconcelosia minhoensis]|nr:FecR domain-containing protein [Romeria gracilis]